MLWQSRTSNMTNRIRSARQSSPSATKAPAASAPTRAARRSSRWLAERSDVEIAAIGHGRRRAAAHRQVLRQWSDSGDADLILTTGGTGVSPRDVTPEATLQVLDRVIPGFSEAMRAASLAKTPYRHASPAPSAAFAIAP